MVHGHPLDPLGGYESTPLGSLGSPGRVRATSRAEVGRPDDVGLRPGEHGRLEKPAVSQSKSKELDRVRKETVLGTFLYFMV